MHMQKQKKMYMLARSLRTCERKSIDAALLRLDELLPSFGPEVVTDAHTMLVKEKRMRIDWATLPSAVDPHSTTWRGSSIPGDGSVDTTSHATMRKTINPRSERKRAQVENFASMLSAAAPPAGSRVVDFGAGSGNLVLPLASLFPQLKFVAVDVKAQSIALLTRRCAAAGLSNVEPAVTSIEAYAAPFDIALSLHACGPASDAVLRAAVGARALFMVSPCCVGKLSAQPSVASMAAQHAERSEASMAVAHSEHLVGPGRRRIRSRRLHAAQVDAETFELFAQLADSGQVIPSQQLPSRALLPPLLLPHQLQNDTQAHFLRAKLCKTAVELDRISWVREQDATFHTTLVRMWGMEDYSKTDLLLGWPTTTQVREAEAREFQPDETAESHRRSPSSPREANATRAHANISQPGSRISGGAENMTGPHAAVYMQNLSCASRRTWRREIPEQALPEQALLAFSETQLTPAQTREEGLEKAAEYTTDKNRRVSQYCGEVLASYITPYRS